MSRRRATLGVDYLVLWRPELLPAAAPDVAITGLAGTPYTLTQIRTPVAVTAINGAGQVLTLGVASAASSRGLVGPEGGRCWLDLEGYGQFPVIVEGFETSTTVRLTQPLPGSVPEAATGTLSWNTWHATIPAAHLAAVAYGKPWTIDYTVSRGADFPAEQLRAAGLFDIVHTPFTTGITGGNLLTYVPALAQMSPAGDPSWGEAIDRAQEALEAALQSRLQAGKYVDDIRGSQFARAHALFAAGLALTGQGAVGYEREVDFFDLAEKEVDRQLVAGLQWLDLNQDGVADAGELNYGAGVPDMTRSHVTAADWDEDTFERFSVTGDR